ncbi:hypothetical protein AB0D04_38220 [Streptomyces sp. NPDC048483]|uniref:hypothetical protein n=1 Tax=Streptomyces sp. NPDC048483 TaxID=3154927 RepID=UPI0034150FDB
MSADGAWRLALATGTWGKPGPAHIGALARQRARQRRIGELTEHIGETNASLAALDDQLRGLAASPRSPLPTGPTPWLRRQTARAGPPRNKPRTRLPPKRRRRG